MNLQNIPQEQDYRTPFSGEENEWLICADYSGIELVLVIEDSKEEVWVKAQNEGLDLHMINAQMTFGMNAWNHAKLPDCTYEEDKKHKCKCPIHGDMRNSTKTVTYASLFGATGERIGKILKIGKNAGETILKKYFKALPTLRNWMDDIIQYAAIYRKIRTFRPYRRTRFFSPDEHPEEMAKKAVNARIQGQWPWLNFVNCLES